MFYCTCNHGLTIYQRFLFNFRRYLDLYCCLCVYWHRLDAISGADNVGNVEDDQLQQPCGMPRITGVTDIQMSARQNHHVMTTVLCMTSLSEAKGYVTSSHVMRRPSLMLSCLPPQWLYRIEPRRGGGSFCAKAIRGGTDAITNSDQQSVEDRVAPHDVSPAELVRISGARPS